MNRLAVNFGFSRITSSAGNNLPVGGDRVYRMLIVISHQFAVTVDVSAEDGFQFTLYAIVSHNKSKWYVELVFSKRILLNITYLKRTVSDTRYRFLQLPLR